MIYCDFQDLPRRTAFGKGLRNIVFNIAKNPKYDGYKSRLVSGVYAFYNKKCSGGKIIRKVEKRKVYSSFEDNIRGANFANMKLLSKCNKEFRF